MHLIRFASVALVFALALSSAFAGDYRVIDRVPTGVGPGTLAVTPDGAMVLCLNSDSADVGRYRLPGMEPLPPVPVGQVPMALDFDGNRALVACFRDDSLWSVDTVAGSARGPLPVGDGPRAVKVVSPGVAWVAGYYDGSLDVVDVSRMKVLQRIQLEIGLTELIAIPGHRFVWAMNSSSDRFHILDRTRAQLERTLVGKLGQGLWDAVLAPDGRRILYSGWGSNTLGVLDGQEGDRVALHPTQGTGAVSVAVTADGTRAWVGHSESDTVTCLDTDSGRVLAEVPVGRFPFSHLAISPDGSEVCVTNDRDRTLSLIDANNFQVVQEIEVGRIPRFILYVGEKLLVSCNMSNQITVLSR